MKAVLGHLSIFSAWSEGSFGSFVSKCDFESLTEMNLIPKATGFLFAQVNKVLVLLCMGFEP